MTDFSDSSRYKHNATACESPGCWSTGNGNRRRKPASRRCGAVLILVVMLLFVLLAIAGLSIDIAMARLTQSHLQSVADAAAIEGGWQMATGLGESQTRDAVVTRAGEMSESWGPKRMELQGGYDLDDDAELESSQTINRETLGDSVQPGLQANIDNAIDGDIVMGIYDELQVPEVLPGQPLGYSRGLTFIPDVDDPNSLLVRLRRTGENDLVGGTSAERLNYLWSRGSLMDLGLKGRGIAVRSESIARLVPAVEIGQASEQGLPTAMSAAIPVSEVKARTFRRESLLTVESPATIGGQVGDSAATTFAGIGYLPIAKEISPGDTRVIGYMVAQITPESIVPSTLVDLGFTVVNATADPQRIAGLSNELLHENRSLAGPFIARVPVLVRSRQIQGVTP